MAAGTRADTVYLLRTGQARVFLAGKAGHETTTAVLGPGQLVGISALLGYPEHHASAEALTPVEAWALPAGGLLEHLPRDPALLELIVGALSLQLGLVEALVRNVSLLPVAERIPDALALLQVCLNGERPRLSHETLAELVGARRETVSRAVAHARARGG
jgi:CRP-like cAMP-binding protein